MNYSNKCSGYGIAEIVVGSSIIAAALFGIIFVAQESIKINANNLKKIQASFLMEEGLEAARIIRDNGWGNYKGIVSNTSYFITFDGTTWSTTTSNSYIDNVFDRHIEVDPVNRDTNDDIAISGTNDPDTKEVTSFISWNNSGSTSTISVSTIITNINGE